MNKKLELSISGRVQGVAFRKSTQKEAEKLGLKGYAKNLQDGSVEIVAEGDEADLRDFLQWCFKGPLLAKVESLKASWKKYSGEYKDFSVIRKDSNILSDQVQAMKNLGKNIAKMPEETIIPTHIAIICDGNRRWAKERDLPVSDGHKAGAERLIKLADEARNLGVKYLTIWAFSTENWKRDEKEVSAIMTLFSFVLKKFESDFHKNQIHFKHIGRKDRLPEKFTEALARMEEATKNYSNYYLNVALDYGGNDEILRAIQKGAAKGINMEKITGEQFEELLDTAGMPHPDLIIRTSGEQRLSGLFSWQSAYSEFYFTPVNLPDFDLNELKKAINEYSRRNRRFGGK